jgi:hypothetical protein
MRYSISAFRQLNMDPKSQPSRGEINHGRDAPLQAISLLIVGAKATARAYRIGQTRTVTVDYPGVVSDAFPSFEVRLDTLLQRKRALAADMLNGCSDLRPPTSRTSGEARQMVSCHEMSETRCIILRLRVAATTLFER